MTALQTIIKEAKHLKSKYPKRFQKWTEYVAQASAIYSSKHKGISPVGKKKVGAIKKKAVKKTAKKSVVKKTAKKRLPNSYYDKLHQAKRPGKRTSASGKTYYENRDNRSDKGKLLGIESNLSISLIKRLEDINKEIEKRQDVIANVIQNKTYFVNKNGKSWYPKFMKLAKRHIAELKKHKIEIKKLV